MKGGRAAPGRWEGGARRSCGHVCLSEEGILFLLKQQDRDKVPTERCQYSGVVTSHKIENSFNLLSSLRLEARFRE